MKKDNSSKLRVVNYVSKQELSSLEAAAKRVGLRKPSQVVGLWMRQKLSEVSK